MHSAVEKYLNNRIDFSRYENPGFEVFSILLMNLINYNNFKSYQNLNEMFIIKPIIADASPSSPSSPSPPSLFEKNLKEFIISEDMEIKDIMHAIIASIQQLFDQNKLDKEKEKEKDLKESFEKFNSLLDLLFYLYLNWSAQNKTYLNEKDDNKLEEQSPDRFFHRINNRIFTVPELEPYSGSLTVVSIPKSKKEISRIPTQKLTSLNNIETKIKRGFTIRRKTMKYENAELKLLKLKLKDIEKFTDAEISETLTHFNMFENFWRIIPLKQKY